MYSDFIEHILKVCKTLNSCNVEFIIVGGTAKDINMVEGDMMKKQIQRK